MDYNNNGVVSLVEIDKAIVELWPEFDHKPALMRAYKAADANNDGYIAGDAEFKQLLHYIIYFTELWDVFKGIDRDHDRRLSLEEFVAGAERLGHKLSRKRAAAEFDAMDSNGGGYVLFNEFCAWCAARDIAAREGANIMHFNTGSRTPQVRCASNNQISVVHDFSTLCCAEEDQEEGP